MYKTVPMRGKSVGISRGGLFFAVLVGILVGSAPLLRGQRPLPPPAAEAATTARPSHRTRLILKDGSYQVVMSYRVKGDRVILVSAERAGAEEEIPLALVDLEATQKWEQQHSAPASLDEMEQAPPPKIDPELLKEEEERRALSPEVAPDLRLPEQDSVLALDEFRGLPELVPLSQSSGDLNQTTSHNVVRGLVNPMSSPHQIVQLKGEKAAAQLHVNQPVLYVRVGEDAGIGTGGTPLVVDTHGASAAPVNNAKPPVGSEYVIVRVDVRLNARVVASFSINRLGDVRRQEDVVETTAEALPGGHWMKLTPKEPLSFGEYALMEVISPKEVNLGVWDFGVHPTAPENRDAVKPEPRKPVTLERRGPDLSPR